jgi:hypothetical protein
MHFAALNLILSEDEGTMPRKLRKAETAEKKAKKKKS